MPPLGVIFSMGSFYGAIVPLENKSGNCKGYRTEYITSGCRRQKLNAELGILNIESLITLANYKFAFKLQNGLLPPKTREICLNDSKQASLLPSHKYNMRNKLVQNLPKNVISQYKNSFLCKGPRSLLTLDVETPNTASLYTFTKVCKQQLLNKNE